MPTGNYSKNGYVTHKLSEEEIENPYLVIHEFFSFVHLPDARQALWEWLKLTVIGNYHRQTCADKSNLIYLYEQVEKLVEAVHIIHQRKKERPSE
jgi:hypothetical protein